MRHKIGLFNFLLIILIIIFIFGCTSSGNTKITDEILMLDDEINSIPVSNISSPSTPSQRTDLLVKIDDFARESVSGDKFSSSIYSLLKVRLDRALKEISMTRVPKGNVKIWYIYNMGVIAKSEDKTIAFDLGGDYAYPDLADFTKYIDILFISHFHGDHIGSSVLREAIKNGVTVIIPGDKVSFNGVELIRDPEGEDAVTLIKKLNKTDFDNLISLKPGEKTIIKGIEITAYPSEHIHDPDSAFTDVPVSWYYVNLSGFTILHAGDGVSLSCDSDFTDKNVDLFIIHGTAIDPRSNDTLMKLVPDPEVILPLHVLELGHGAGIVNGDKDQRMTYQNILDNYSNGYYKGLNKETELIPMIWGESILF